MKVLKLTLKDYRNISSLEFIPDSEMNVICGENAQGKTNILEALWLFTGAKSFRTSKDVDFLRFGSEKSVLELEFLSQGVEKTAKIEIDDKRKASLQENKLKSPSLLAGNFNAVIFSPADLRLVTDGPALRRRFLDTGIGQLYPSYIELLRNYLRAVTQRNKIIKDFKYDSSLSVMLDVFEEEIVTYGQKIINLRKKYINTLNEFLPAVYNGISSGKEELDTEYITKSEEYLREKLILARNEDMYSGVTSIGPHRDDLEFKINGINARNFGSQGQKRSVSLSLKLAEAEVLRKIGGECPVFLLDDVMSELDPERQNFILNHIKGMQVFITCCDPSNVKQLENGKIFKIKEGQIV